MSTAAKRRYTEAEYLAFDRASEIKHEFYRGEIFAMSGASKEHNQITFNIALCLGQQLRDRQCSAFVNDMRVKVKSTVLYTYPDAVITCQEPRFEDSEIDTLLNPQVVIEVLSDSTEKYDRGKKFEHYRTVLSLREYILVSQDHAHIDHFAMNDQEQWVLSDATGLDKVVDLSTVGCRLPLAEVYAKVKFLPAEEIVPTPI